MADQTLEKKTHLPEHIRKQWVLGFVSGSKFECVNQNPNKNLSDPQHWFSGYQCSLLSLCPQKFPVEILWQIFLATIFFQNRTEWTPELFSSAIVELYCQIMLRKLQQQLHRELQICNNFALKIQTHWPLRNGLSLKFQRKYFWL
jgi:hypothetical protein